MIRKAIAVACFCLAASPAAALDPDYYHVRNDTGRSLTCGLRWRGRIDRFVLVRGTETTRSASGGVRRTLLCDSAPVTQRFRMRPGIHYALVTNGVEITLRPVASSD